MTTSPPETLGPKEAPISDEDVARKRDQEAEQRLASRLLDVLVRAGLLLAMLFLCYRIFSPFLTLTAWAVILAVTLHPLHQLVARAIGERQGLAATLLVLLGIVLIVVPTAVLMSSLGDSVHRLIDDVQSNALDVPAPRAGVAEWPVIGPEVYAVWSRAHADLPSLVQSMQPKIGDLAKAGLGFVAGIGGGLLRFLAAFVVAGVLMAFGEAGDRASRAIFARAAGPERGAEFVRLSTATIRAVAQGVIGIAFLQAIVVGLCLLVAGVPWAGALAAVCLVLGVAQVPAVVVTLPAIVYVWAGSDHGRAEAVAYTILLLVAGMADNVLKPLLLGRGVDAPMPVILLGALGGMATAGIVGMFLGATLLALGYQIVTAWVATGPDDGAARDAGGQRPAA
jgi:predicted PurR-regulated permease PerM